MRLLHARCFNFKLFPREPPGYAILSHRWSEHEPLLQDIEQNRDHPSTAQCKVRGFADYITSHLPQLDWIWVDSCCIDQKSAAELSEGVNCMFEWYRNASVCIAYLSDVKHPSDRLAFRRSVWFQRGWTLQELVASTVVIFVTDTWQVIGHKGNAGHLEQKLDVGPNLESLISEVTGVPYAVLQDFSNSHALSVDQRMHWMNGRETLKDEDLSYALFGIFGVTPGANYGEKRSGAAQRLREAIARKQYDGTGLAPSRCSPQVVPPQHSIPFARDSAFIERREISVLREKFSNPGARVAIVGLGGIGKSQLAIEHCYTTINGPSNTWVFWLHASSAARFDQEVSNLIDDLSIIKQDKDANVFQLFRSWLIDVNKKWLIVLDNADDADFLFEAPEFGNQRSSTKARIDYFPVCLHGSILVTTRRQAIALRLSSINDIIVLEPERDLANKLLGSKLGLSEATAEVKKLAASLDYIPLAIAQAAAYINQRKPRCTVEDYLHKLEKSERSKSSLLRVHSEELHRDRQEAENSILLTWQISFEHVRAIRQSAADLLSLMSFYDHQGIPDFLLRTDARTDDEHDEESDSTSEDDMEDAFEEDIAVLRDYSFVSVTMDRSTLQMHRLVQLAAQVWLRERTKQYEQYQAQSLCRLDSLYPNAHYEAWKRCQTLQAHAKRLCDVKVKGDVAVVSLASILHKAAWYTESQGLYSEAVIMAARAFHERKRVLGADHLDTLTSMNRMAMIYWRQGQYKEAEVLVKKVVEMRTRVLGEEHLDTLVSMNTLALTYCEQGRYKEAEELHIQKLEITKRVFGEEHPDTLASMSNLALTYYDQGRYKDAEGLQIEVMEMRKRVLGEKHPDTLTSVNNLALTYWRQGRYWEAEELQIKVLETRKGELSEEHPDVLTSLDNLALTYQKQGRCKEAEELQVKVIDTRKRVLGEEHPGTLTSMHSLAMTYFCQERLQDAWKLMKQCLQSLTAVLSETHPYTLLSAERLRKIEVRMQAASNQESEASVADLAVDDAADGGEEA